MKAVLMSINPRWCELIASGRKTVEVRKTRPKLETPLKVYIYCTKGKPLMKTANNSCFIDNEYRRGENLYGLYELVNGKVIGEFICDKIYDIKPHYDIPIFCNQYEYGWKIGEAEDCLSFEELDFYLGGKNGYGWHISDLVIYDKPRELTDFYVWKKCNACRDTGYESTACCYDEDCKVPAVISRPPQSWCYVESEGAE